jgi:hypothetical protein
MTFVFSRRAAALCVVASAFAASTDDCPRRQPMPTATSATSVSAPAM